MIILAYVVGGIALLACSAAFVWYRAGKVDEYLEPSGSGGSTIIIAGASGSSDSSVYDWNGNDGSGGFGGSFVAIVNVHPPLDDDVKKVLQST